MIKLNAKRKCLFAENMRLNLNVILSIGIALIVMGGASYFFAQQPFTDCPSFMGLAVGAIPQNILDRCLISWAF